MSKIVVVGSINMDLVVRCARLPRPGETIMADSAAEIPGGKGANQAVAAARAGGDVAIIGRIGDDAFADRLLQNLDAESIDTSHIRTCQQTASGIAIVAVEQGGENAITVVPGANAFVSPDDVVASTNVIQSADVLLVQLEIPLPTVRQAISIAKAAHVPVILDPAPMPTEIPSNLLNVDVICPNQSEAAAITGAQVLTLEEGLAALAPLHAAGAKNAIVTMAADGAVVSDGKNQRHLDAFATKAIDTTAAGDAFAGALAVRIAEGATLIQAARFASAAGALAASNWGAQPAMPLRIDIENLIAG